METNSHDCGSENQCLLEHFTPTSYAVIHGCDPSGEGHCACDVSPGPLPFPPYFPYIEVLPCISAGGESVGMIQGEDLFPPSFGRWFHVCRDGRPEFVACSFQGSWKVFCYDERRQSEIPAIIEKLDIGSFPFDGIMFQLDNDLDILKIGFLEPKEEAAIPTNQRRLVAQ